MQLSVLERLLVQSLIPTTANFTNLKLIRKAREALSFTEEENKLLVFRHDGVGADTKTLWNDGVVGEREIDLGDTVFGLVVKELKKLDSENKLTSDHFSIYEKFVENKE